MSDKKIYFILLLSIGLSFLGMAKEIPFRQPISYFPRLEKASWLYHIGNPDGKIHEITLSNGFLTNYFNHDETFKIKISQNKVWIIQDTEAWLLYDFSSPQSWTIPEKALPEITCVAGSTLMVVEKGITVQVPAGTFENCIRIQWDNPCMDAGILEEVFAPGVGLIRRVESRIYGTQTWELFSAQLGDHPVGDNISLNCSISPTHFVDHLTIACILSTTMHTYHLIHSDACYFQIYVLNDAGGIVFPPEPVACAQVITEMDLTPEAPLTVYDTIPLDPTLPPGRYTVEINIFDFMSRWYVIKD